MQAQPPAVHGLHMSKAPGCRTPGLTSGAHESSSFEGKAPMGNHSEPSVVPVWTIATEPAKVGSGQVIPIDAKPLTPERPTNCETRLPPTSTPPW